MDTEGTILLTDEHARCEAVQASKEMLAEKILKDEILDGSAFEVVLGSRYCDTDRLADFAWKNFSATPLGWPRVQAIVDFVHSRIVFNYEKADPLRTAFGGFNDRTGVCRDFAHLAITLCRCMNIPTPIAPVISVISACPKTPTRWISAPGAKSISAAAGVRSMPVTTRPASDAY